MYKAFYFLHIVSVVAWIGTFLAFGFLLRSLTKQNHVQEPLLKKMTMIVNRWILPAALLVIVSGAFMIESIGRNNLPLYITLMERTGSLIILATIIVLTWFSRKMNKQLVENNNTISLSKTYANYLLISAVLGLGVVAIVALRII